MIELEIGKAIAAVESENGCFGCFLEGEDIDCAFHKMKCIAKDRKDGKSVIFKIVDFNSHYIDGTMRGKQ